MAYNNGKAFDATVEIVKAYVENNNDVTTELLQQLIDVTYDKLVEIDDKSHKPKND